MTDWRAWHEPYDDPDSPLSQRLSTVRRHVEEWLRSRGDASSAAISMCAGQGRDLLPLLADRPNVRARLVELDPASAAVASAGAGPNVSVVVGDAGSTDAYAGAVPADLVMACGVFGNVPDDDVRHTVFEPPRLCAEGATVVWTRTRRPPDLTPAIRTWFAEAGFEERAFDAPGDAEWSVGVHVLVDEPQPYRAGQRLFTFGRGPTS